MSYVDSSKGDSALEHCAVASTETLIPKREKAVIAHVLVGIAFVSLSRRTYI